jgi:hypothetical protein
MKLRTVGGGAPSIAHARAVDAITSEVTIVRTGARCAADFNGVRLPRSSNAYSERSCENKSHRGSNQKQKNKLRRGGERVQ